MNRTAERTWIERNLKWLLLAGMLLCLLALAGFVGGVLMIASMAIRSSDVHEMAMQRVRAQPEAVAALGEPIEPGFLASGSIQVDGRSGTADLGVPVHGSRAEGTVSVVARKQAGEWYYDQLELRIEGGPSLDLRTPAQAAAAESVR